MIPGGEHDGDKVSVGFKRALSLTLFINSLCFCANVLLAKKTTRRHQIIAKGSQFDKVVLLSNTCLMGIQRDL